MRRKTILSLFLVFSLALVLVGCGKKTTQESEESGKKESQRRVYVTTPALYDFARMIGGEKVEVENLVQGGGDLHHWEPSPDLIRKINQADLFLINGAGLEGWLDNLSASLDPSIKLVDTSQGIDLIMAEHDHDEDHDHDEGHNHDEDHDHDHGGKDPHFWTSLKAAKVQAKNVYQAFLDLDPENKDYFKEQWGKLEKVFQDLDDKYSKALAGKEGKTLIVPHLAFSYLCRDYGFQQVGLQGHHADGQLSAGKIRQIVDLATSQGITTIFYEGFGDDSAAQNLAMEIAGKALPLYTIESINDKERENGENYFTLMEKNLESIVQSFEGESGDGE